MRTTAGAATLMVGLGPLASLAGCSDHPESFQAACLHLETALFLIEDGEVAKAKDELTRAHSWAVPAFEDATGTDLIEVVSEFSRAVGVALDEFGTEEGRQGLSDAEDACS